MVILIRHLLSRYDAMCIVSAQSDRSIFIAEEAVVSWSTLRSLKPTRAPDRLHRSPQNGSRVKSISGAAAGNYFHSFRGGLEGGFVAAWARFRSVHLVYVTLIKVALQRYPL